eukprot:CAMPEP_0114231564 /NCGR_PEP_ID=MMETSP0058-20121206/4119_1 /TAXON_ID=36894 /ORGANISM="Pyramimonas parkeae, CCMP726" /LENGTH=181 /DNA_ID=CAMNT_0001342937 /DNA_START=191 /DNA_END=733 /DNA_ORIENTATION=+
MIWHGGVMLLAHVESIKVHVVTKMTGQEQTLHPRRRAVASCNFNITQFVEKNICLLIAASGVACELRREEVHVCVRPPLCQHVQAVCRTLAEKHEGLLRGAFRSMMSPLPSPVVVDETIGGFGAHVGFESNGRTIVEPEDCVVRVDGGAVVVGQHHPAVAHHRALLVRRNQVRFGHVEPGT